MAINLGSTAIADAKLGTTQVEKIYLGSEQVWGGNEELDWIIVNPTGVEIYDGEPLIEISDVDLLKSELDDDGVPYTLPLNFSVSGDDFMGEPAMWQIDIFDAHGTQLFMQGYNFVPCISFTPDEHLEYPAFAITFDVVNSSEWRDWHIANVTGDVTVSPDINMAILQNFVTENNVNSVIHVTWPARQGMLPHWQVDTDSGVSVIVLTGEMYNELGVTCTWGSGTPSFDIIKD